MPEPEIPGVNRPPLGSERVWERLHAGAGAPAGGLLLGARVAAAADGPLLMVRLENVGANVVRWSYFPLGSGPYVAPLLRDTSGAIVRPNDSSWTTLDDGTIDRERTSATVATPAGERRLRLYPELRPRASTAEFRYPLCLQYDLHPGEHYTVLSAAAVTGDVNRVLVAPPITFTVPAADGKAVEIPAHQTSHKPTGCAARASEAKTFDKQWEELARFAGKTFEGLELTAETGAGGESTGKMPVAHGGAALTPGPSRRACRAGRPHPRPLSRGR